MEARLSVRKQPGLGCAARRGSGLGRLLPVGSGLGCILLPGTPGRTWFVIGL